MTGAPATIVAFEIVRDAAEDGEPDDKALEALVDLYGPLPDAPEHTVSVDGLSGFRRLFAIPHGTAVREEMCGRLTLIENPELPPEGDAAWGPTSPPLSKLTVLAFWPTQPRSKIGSGWRRSPCHAVI